MVGSEGLMVWEEETGLFFSFFFFVYGQDRVHDEEEGGGKW
jgi:hypothetical protein